MQEHSSCGDLGSYCVGDPEAYCRWELCSSCLSRCRKAPNGMESDTSGSEEASDEEAAKSS